MSGFEVRADCGCFHKKNADGSSVTRPCGKGGHETLNSELLLERIAPLLSSHGAVSQDALRDEVKRLGEELGGERHAASLLKQERDDLRAQVLALTAPHPSPTGGVSPVDPTNDAEEALREVTGSGRTKIRPPRR